MRCLGGLAVIPALLAVTLATAAPSSHVVWTAETVRLVKTADPDRGKELAYGCAGCHGESGLGTAPIYPHIAGQDARYLYKQLHDFRDKTRVNKQMNAIATNLTEQDMADMAAFYASQPLPSGQTPGDASAAIALVTRGDGTRMIPACQGCHGPRGGGQPGYYGMPVLAGQSAIYLQMTLGEYQSGYRSNDVYAIMRNIAVQLSGNEIKALGNYYSAQQAD